MTISNQAAGMRAGVCLSTNRPVSPYKGQMIYETDTDMMAVWNGSAWRYIAATTPTNGTVLQVVSVNQSSQQTYTSSTPSTGNMSLSITPKASSSKILVIANINGINRQSGDTGLNLWIYKNSSSLIQFGRMIGKLHGSTTQINDGSASCSYIDSPSTTSSISYDVYGASHDNVAYALFNHGSATTSSLVLMEIAG